MTTNLPINSPAQGVMISPEALEIANVYMSLQNVQATADKLRVDASVVAETLDKHEVRAYIDTLFLDSGFNNRYRMRDVMDAIIQKKLQELDEADVGSGKDIADLLALSHKMTMDVLEKQLQLEKLRAAKNTPSTQVNMQVNEYGDSKYGALIQRLLSGG